VDNALGLHEDSHIIDRHIEQPAGFDDFEAFIHECRRVDGYFFTHFPGWVFQRLRDGDIIQVGKLQFTVLETPGHSPGSISLYGHDVVFTGDALFLGSIGRTDLPGGSHEMLLDSIQQKLLVLPEETIVYSGHGPDTTIGQERDFNPFLT